jgi:putative methyltransferase (TIGR04325 family)
VSVTGFLKAWCPPALELRLKRFSSGAVRYSRRYGAWEDAAAASSGYDHSAILARVVQATRSVVRGEAAFERDSVLFDKLEHPFHLLAPMLRAAAEANGVLSVLDYGGALGSTYRQCRSFLGNLRVTWSVIEQPSFVAAGQAEFETDELRFYARVDDALARTSPNVVLFSSVLQYLPDPLAAIGAVQRSAARFLVIDRTPFHAGAVDCVCVQKIPPRIYPGSYPLWVFARERFVAALGSEWRLTADFTSPEGLAMSQDGLLLEYRGLILERNGC